MGDPVPTGLDRLRRWYEAHEEMSARARLKAVTELPDLGDEKPGVLCWTTFERTEQLKRGPK